MASRQAAEAFAPLSGVPVSVLRLPVEVPDCPSFDRKSFRIPDGFLFLTSFDYAGSPERKNPLGAIRAFKTAFPPGSGASLVVKSTNGQERPAESKALEAAAADHPDVHLRDRYLVPQVNHALTAACDCYVSLHRSTSFGLAPAKAMYLGKPVIATGHGGNLDFMDDGNAFLVESEEGAAAAMRTVFEDRAAAAQRARRGAGTIRERHSRKQAARSVAALLEPALLRVARRMQAGPVDARSPIWADSQRRAAELAALRRAPNGDDSHRGRLLREIHSIPNWWHSIDLGDGIVTPGRKGGGSAWMASELDCLRLPDVRERTVLDVGAWDGFYSFEAERRGATRVVALDWLIWRATPTGRLPADPDSLPGKRGFDIAHAALSSTVESVAADFMEVDLDGLGSFDVVLFLGVLYHLQDPLGAMRRLAQVTGEVAVIETEAVAPPGLDGRPLVEFFGSNALAGDTTNWWVPSLQALLDLCEVAGFSRTEVTGVTSSPTSTAAVNNVPTSPPAASEPVKQIPVDQQIELFKWILEEKRKVKTKDPQEKKKIDEEKALLKQFIRSKTVPSL